MHNLQLSHTTLIKGLRAEPRRMFRDRNVHTNVYKQQIFHLIRDQINSGDFDQNILTHFVSIR